MDYLAVVRLHGLIAQQARRRKIRSRRPSTNLPRADERENVHRALIGKILAPPQVLVRDHPPSVTKPIEGESRQRPHFCCESVSPGSRHLNVVIGHVLRFVEPHSQSIARALVGRSNASSVVVCVMRHPSTAVLEVLDPEQNFNVRFTPDPRFQPFCFLIWMTRRITT